MKRVLATLLALLLALPAAALTKDDFKLVRPKEQPARVEPPEPSKPVPLYPAPPGAGWQWDDAHKHWWRMEPRPAQRFAPAEFCPGQR